MTQDEAKTIPLTGARTPADAGLSGLGLLMQLTGSVFLAYGALLVMLPFLGGTRLEEAIPMLTIGALSVVRSSFHRRAGIGLLFKSAKGPLHGVWVYVGVAVAQTLAVFVLLDDELPTKTRLFLVILLVAWPLALTIMLSRPRFQQIGKTLPRNEDMGFEAAGIMMTILGILGAMVSSLVILTIYQSPFFQVQDVPSFLWLGVTFMLLVRSILHAKAGLQICRGASTQEASQSTARYTSFGITSAIVAAAVLMLQMLMQGGLHPAMFMTVGVMGYLLLAWPLLLRNFFTDRNFALLLDDDNVTTRRAPDMGLTALGWMLLALGSLNLASSAGTVLFLDSSPLGMQMTLLPEIAGAGTHSIWWSVLLAALQTAAGVELIRMSPRHKIVTTLYATLSIAGTLFLWWPMIKSFSGEHLSGPMDSIQVYGMLMISLAVAVSSLLLVHRRSIHSAQAHITP